MPGLTPPHKNLLGSLGLVLAVHIFAPATLAQASQRHDNPALRIHRYAAFNAQLLTSTNKTTQAVPRGQASRPARQRAQVNVYGKQLTLSLENNDQLTDALATSSNIEVLRGKVEGQQQSWVRLTRTANGTHGLIWDGSELYAIEPAGEVSGTLAPSLPAPRSATVIFKLSDTTIDLGAEYCGVADHGSAAATTGLATYQALASELSAASGQVGAANGEPTLRLEMQALADAAFRAEYSSDQAALDAIMVRLNNVDGIFSTQIGLEIQATDIQIYATDPAALSNSTQADTLLNSLGKLRSNTTGMTSYGATHLFTGRDLDGDTLGIAYIGNVCGREYGASLSEARDRGAWIESLLVAHELGHQLGAVHDDADICAGTPPQSYLMSAQINDSSELSQCSRQSILATMQYAACLIPIGAPDVSVSNDSSLQMTPDTQLAWSLPIRNVGTGTAHAPSVHVSLPANVIVESSAIAGGSCISSNADTGGQIDCEFDALAANETRSVEISLYSNTAGNYAVAVSVAVAMDNNPYNNNATFNLAVIDSAATGGGAPAPATSQANHGGGGAWSSTWLLLAGLALLRRQPRSLSRGNTAQPLH